MLVVGPRTPRPMLWCWAAHFHGRMPGDESGEFTCLANGGHNIVDHIVGSLVVWQVVTHFKVIIDDTRYCTVGGNSNHKSLRLRLSINCSFVELQHMVEIKKFLPRFKYNKSKAEKYIRSCSPCRDLSIGVSHSRIGHRERVDSQLLVVGSQTASLTGPSFAHNLGCRCPNREC